MKRWDFATMISAGRKLFASIHRKKHLANPNHKTIVPHARTLRNAREQVKQMVIDGVSLGRIRSYLSRWCTWWVKSSQSWQYEEIMKWFIQVCRDSAAMNIAATLLEQAAIKRSYSATSPAGLDVHATA